MTALARIAVALVVGVSTAWAWQQKLPSVYSEFTSGVVTPSGDVAVARCAGTADLYRDRLVVAMLRGATGAQRWQRSIPRTDYCSAGYLIADDAGDLFVATALTAVDPTRRAVIKLAGLDGRELWRHETGAGFPRGLARRADGSIVVSDDDATTALDAETGAVLWSVHYEGTLGLLDSDAQGDLFAVLTPPRTDDPLDDPGNIIVVKLDGASGGEIWRRVFDGTNDAGGGSWDVATDLAVDGAGDVVVVGWLTNAHPHVNTAPWDEDVVVAKLAGPSGEEQWQTLLVGTKGGDDRGYRVTIAENRDPLVSLKLDGTPRLARFAAASGDLEWQADWGTGEPEEFVTSIVMDPAGDVLVLGKYAARVAAAKFAGATGDEQWVQTFVANRPSHHPYDLSLNAHAFALGARGEITLTGTATRLVEDGSRSLGATTAISVASTVAGKRLVIRDDGAIRKVTLLMSDPHITPALPGGPGDPSISGATLAFTSAAGGDHIVLALPAGGWSKRAEGGFQYRGSGGRWTCPEVVLAPGSLTARCRTDDSGLLLDAPLGSVDVTFTLGEPGFPYCASFGGTVKQDRPVSADAPGLFRATDAAPPPSCGG